MRHTIEILEEEEVLQTTTCTPKNIYSDIKGWTTAFEVEILSFLSLDAKIDVHESTLDLRRVTILPGKAVMVTKNQMEMEHIRRIDFFYVIVIFLTVNVAIMEVMGMFFEATKFKVHAEILIGEMVQYMVTVIFLVRTVFPMAMDVYLVFVEYKPGCLACRCQRLATCLMRV